MARRNAFVPGLLCALVAACSEKPLPTAAPAPTLSYGSPGCFSGMPAAQVCQLLDGPDAIATSYCMYGACFTMTYGEMVKVVAADEQGEFPRTWFAWGNVALTPTGSTPCLLREEGKKKTRVEIAPGKVRCKASCTVDSYTYNEHFASNPAAQCLGWIECKVPVAPPD